MMKTEIKDNHLSNQEHQNIIDGTTSIWFPWGFVPSQVRPKDKDGKDLENFVSPILDDWHLTHVIYDGNINSPCTPAFDHLVESLKPTEILRVKINLLLPCGKPIESGFHTDMGPEKVKTSIYYVNTCNGYTELEDGTKVDCVANRLVTFDSSMKHNAVRQTDTKQRIVINICWK